MYDTGITIDQLTGEEHLAAAKAAASQVPAEFDWRVDGPKLMTIIDHLFFGFALIFGEPFMDQVSDETLAQAISDRLQQWDDDYGWDAPRMSEATEDRFYAWMAAQRVKQLR